MQTLTEEQAQRWNSDGFLHIEGALTDDQVAMFSAELDRFRQLPGWEPSMEVLGHYTWLDHAADTSKEGFMDRRDVLPLGQHFIDLIDHPGIFDLIVDIMGPQHPALDDPSHRATRQRRIRGLHTHRRW